MSVHPAHNSAFHFTIANTHSSFVPPSQTAIPHCISPLQTAFLVPAARFARGFCFLLRAPGMRGGGAPRYAPVLGAPAGRALTRHARRLARRHASLGDARLSALHRGDFGPGAALFPRRQLPLACASASNRIGSSELLAHGS